MVSDKSWLCRTAPKLKHTALEQIYYQLLNTSLIFMYNSWNNCSCDQFQGCWIKPLWRRLDGQQHYYACWVKVAYNADKIYKLKKITEIYNNYRKWKKIFNYVSILVVKIFWLYHYKTTGEGKWGRTYWRYLKNYINNAYYNVCYYNKQNNNFSFFTITWFVVRCVSFSINQQIWCYLKPITLQTKDFFALMVINNWVIFVPLIKNNIKLYLFCIFFSDYSFMSTKCTFCCTFFTRFLWKSFATIKNCLY